MSDRLQYNARTWDIGEGAGPNDDGTKLREARREILMDIDEAARAIGIVANLLWQIEVGKAVLRRKADYTEFVRRMAAAKKAMEAA